MKLQDLKVKLRDRRKEIQTSGWSTAFSHMSTCEWADAVQQEEMRGVPLTWLLTLSIILTLLPAMRDNVNVCDQALGQFFPSHNKGSPKSPPLPPGVLPSS